MRYAIEANRSIEGKVRINDRFWTPKLDTFFSVTLKDTFTKLEKDGVLDNYRDLIAGREGTHRACPWHDGLMLETIRGAADYIRRGEHDDTLIARLEGYARLIAEAQQAGGGGYISTYTQLDRATQRYGENGGSILWQHDLYNNGCLFEAGVHLYRATGSVTLLTCAVRSANDLANTIGEPPKKWIIPGHELPEYALIELIELLEDEPALADKLGVPFDTSEYRTLVHFWVHGRGVHEHRTNHPQYMGEYSQDHVPVEQQFQAVGHAVRATLYYTGVTRLAMLENDPELLNTSRRLWENVTCRKMHINGGIGATHFEEKFGEDYDLVNTAYLETCATVGLIFWAESMSRATGDAEYFNVIERALYNLMLSSVTLQGDSYFYRNPLTSDGSDHHWSWHTCPCCPPMIHKTFGMFDRLIYAQDDEAVYVNLPVGSELETELGGTKVKLTAVTDLPWKGSYTITIDEADKAFVLKLRKPEWADRPSVALNGKPIEARTEKGYICITVRAGDTVSLTDEMQVHRVETHPYVRCDRGMVAVARGPLIYCVEAVDNHGDAEPVIAEAPDFRIEERPDLLGGITVIHGKTQANEVFTAIPLYAWDNRLAGKMNVWLKQAGKPNSWDTAGWEKRLYRKYCLK